MSGINLAAGETSIARVVAAIRQLMAGRSNAAGHVTLAANAASTTVAAPNCGPNSEVLLTPRSPHASAELAAGGCYVSAIAAGSFTITHANNSQTDRTFSYAAIG